MKPLSIYYLLILFAFTGCKKDKVNDNQSPCDPNYGPVYDEEISIVRTDTFQTIIPSQFLLYIDTAYKDIYEVYPGCGSNFYGSYTDNYYVHNLPDDTLSNSSHFIYYEGPAIWPAVISNYFSVQHTYMLQNCTSYGYQLYLLMNSTRDSIAITCEDGQSCSFQTVVGFK